MTNVDEFQTKILNKFWSPVQEVVKYNARLCDDKGYTEILELGPGFTLFPKANYFVDFDPSKVDPEIREGVWNVDLDVSDFPQLDGDKKFDFCYARHIFEDVQNPDFIFSGMVQNCRAGYVETPSPLVECLKGVDAVDVGRGYHHHRYIMWTEGNELHMIPKLPIIEYITFEPEFEKKLYTLANSSSVYWNNYYWWDFDSGSPPRFVMHKHFNILGEYGTLLTRAINSSIENTNRVVKALDTWGTESDLETAIV